MTGIRVTRYVFLILFSVLFAVSAGADEAVSYSNSIQPIFDRKCVACHACNDAPCQLNLGSGDGLLRGATKIQVYDGTRIRTQAPTRLFVDARDAREWRARDFASVLGRDGGAGVAGNAAQASLLARMIEMGHRQVLVPNAKLSDEVPVGTDFAKSCALDDDQFEKFSREFPARGMPLGVTGLSEPEYQTLQRWLAQGAPVDRVAVTPTAGEAREIAEWEALLNKRGAREQLVARWLYEHLFLAHLYFSDAAGGHFFELVRSRTGSGTAIDLIATTQPNESPGPGPFHYRLRPVAGAIVHKTHITFLLSPEKRARIHSLFFAGAWPAGELPGYGEAARANPFATFAAIPPAARYQFMLDNAEYFVRTFIRGPVCRGNIATDVIRDNFWVFFQTPDRDIYLTDAAHRAAATPLLSVPGQAGGAADFFPQWWQFARLRNEYSALRVRDYGRLQPHGAALADIWAGDGHNDNAVLSIYRHHDSASVRKGLWGEVPQTMWLLDYPLFERIYYSLVVNFNVFGTASHQGQTRLYFDLIRHGAESAFLRLMPPGARQPLSDDWYQDSGRLKMWLYYPPVETRQPSAIRYATRDPKKEFSDLLLHRFESLNFRPDPINRCPGNAGGKAAAAHCYRDSAPAFVRAADQAFSRIAATPASRLPGILFLPEASMVRVHAADGQREIYTMLRNRAHSNVAYMAAESLRYEPERDTLTIYPGVLASYPNFAFNVPAAEINEFVAALQAADHPAGFNVVVRRWGVRRSHPEFWSLFHDYTTYMREHEPVEAAILDMNRYQNL